MKVLILIGLLFIIFSEHTYAQALGIYDQSIYDHTISQCGAEEPSLTFGLKFIESMKHSLSAVKEVFVDFKLTRVKSALRDRGLTEEMASILDSEGFYRALKACYPGNQSRQDRFAFSLILADVVGRAVGTIQGVTALILTGRVASQAFLFASKTIRGTRYGSSLEYIFAGNNKYFFGGIVMGLIAIDAILNQKNKLKTEEATAQSEGQSISEVLDSHIVQINLRISLLTNKSSSEDCKLIEDVVAIQKSFLNLLSVSPSFIQKKYEHHRKYAIENQIIQC